MSLLPESCQSLYPPLLDFGVKVQCEREFGHTRSWHQATDSEGRRTQWEWTTEEREVVKQWKRLEVAE